MLDQVGGMFVCVVLFEGLTVMPPYTHLANFAGSSATLSSFHAAVTGHRRSLTIIQVMLSKTGLRNQGHLDRQGQSGFLMCMLH